jgi:predicted 2-oxoglutarate/Fe(II)-dependent dioxygenase YbiX
MKQLQDYIFVENAIPLPIRQKLLDQFDSKRWVDHAWYNPITKQNEREEIELKVNAADSYQTELLMPIIVKSIQNYFEKNLLNVTITTASTIRFNKYDVGTSMKPHHDHIHTLFDGEHKGIPALSIVGLLNDDFEGGDFIFFEDTKQSLCAGDLMIWPSCFLYEHEITKITKGTRYSFVAWAW